VQNIFPVGQFFLNVCFRHRFFRFSPDLKSFRPYSRRQSVIDIDYRDTGAQLLSIVKELASPLKLAPYPTLGGDRDNWSLTDRHNAGQRPFHAGNHYQYLCLTQRGNLAQQRCRPATAHIEILSL